MIRYIALLNYTDKGRSQIKESADRGRQFKDLAAQSGVTIAGQYWTVGCHDGVLALEADEETKILSLLAQLSSSGYVEVNLLRALSDSEFDAIVAS